MGASQTNIVPQLDGVSSTWRTQVQNIAGSNSIIGCDGLTVGKRVQLYAGGMTKAICPFGVLIMGNPSYPDSYLWYAANIVSNILDQDNDGLVDNVELAASLQVDKFWFMAGGDDAGIEKNMQEKTDASPLWNGVHLLKAYAGNENDEDIKRIIQEEVMHFFSLRGWAQTWPAKFGVDDFTSDLCQQMAKVECSNPGWQHPENTCNNPGTQQNPPLTGTCSEAKCDCVEFFYQTVAIRNGQSVYWKSATMPSTPANMNAMLDSDYKAMMADATYGIPQIAFTGTYDVYMYQAAKHLSAAAATALGVYVSIN